MGLSPFESHYNFGGIAPGLSARKAPRYSVLPVPYDLTSSYLGGMRNGPGAIAARLAYKVMGYINRAVD